MDQPWAPQHGDPALKGLIAFDEKNPVIYNILAGLTQTQHPGLFKIICKLNLFPTDLEIV